MDTEIFRIKVSHEQPLHNYENFLKLTPTPPPPQKLHFGAFYKVENSFTEFVVDKI